MLNVFDYIENYCKVNNVKSKSLKSNVLTLDDVTANTRFTFAPGVAFFYHTCCVGAIHNIANLDKKFLLIETPTDVYDFAKIANVRDDGALQRAESDFVFTAENTMQITLSQGDTSLFNSISSFQMFYIYMSILRDNQERNSKIYDITINR